MPEKRDNIAETGADEAALQMERYRARQRRRSIAIALGLAILVAIFYALTIVKLGPTVFQRDL